MSKTRIIEATKKLDIESVRKLLDMNPSLLNVPDRGERNLLHIACSVDCKKLHLPEIAAVRMADLLLDHGLDIESYVLDRSCDARCTPLFFAVALGRNTALIKHLLKRGTSVRNSPGGCLFAAGWYDDVDHLDILIRAGADIDPVVGVTPFFACWGWKKFEAAKFLATNGANANYQEPKKGRTALHIGIEKEYDPALLKWLVQHGASPDIKDKEGITARERAARKRDKRWLKALFSDKAPTPRAREARGRS